MRILRILPLIALMLAGCVTRLGRFNTIAPGNVDWSRSSEFKRTEQRVEGSDMAQLIVFVPTKYQVTIETAVEHALAQVPGAIALQDGEIYGKFFWIPFIYGESGYMVQGSVLIDPKLAGSTAPQPTREQ